MSLSWASAPGLHVSAAGSRDAAARGSAAHASALAWPLAASAIQTSAGEPRLQAATVQTCTGETKPSPGCR